MKNKKKNNSSLDDFGIKSITFVDTSPKMVVEDTPRDESINEKENPIMSFLNRIDRFVWDNIFFPILDKIWSFIDNHRKHHINFICTIEHCDKEEK